MGLTQTGTDGIKDDAITLAKQAAGTDGQIITYDASGNPVAVGPGTDGQVLTSTGAGSPPAFEAIPTPVDATKTTLTGSTNNTITTVTGANAIQGEANLTFDGTNLQAKQTGDTGQELIFDSNRSAADNVLGGITGYWDTDRVADISFRSGADTTNKDDGYITFRTSPSQGSIAESMRIDSSGRVLIGTTVEGRATWGENFTIADSASCGMTIRSGSGSYGSLYFSDGESGADEYTGLVEYYHQTNQLAFYTATAQRLVLDNSGNVSINDGDLKIGTSGHGIDFSATSDASGATSELLDDYEIGTFTPLLGGSNYGSYNITGNGKYTKIGRQVFYQIQFANKDLDNNASGDVRVRGWPFSFSISNTSRQITTNIMANNVGLAVNGIHTLYGESDGISMHGIQSHDSTGWSSWNITNFHASGLYLDITGSYMTS